MLFYMAPMEGLTGYIFRNAYHKYFNDIDKYFTPFISSTGLNHKELNDVLPEHNKGLNVVPQILTNKAEDFLEIATRMKDFGYQTVNLNLGCPSGTVVAKKRGAGFLAYPEELDEFLYEIFERCPLNISIKTRIGLETPDEWEQLQKIYNKYPIEELIIHPRVQKDFYRNPVRLETFAEAFEKCNMPICYNGELHTVGSYEDFARKFYQVDKVMLGRGIFKNPGLIGEIKGKPRIEKAYLKEFHDEILEGYREIMSGDKNTLFKMKEIWVYLGEFFENSEKQLKKIKKADSVSEYKIAVNRIFSE